MKERKCSIMSSYKWMTSGKASPESTFYIFEFYETKRKFKQIWDSTIRGFWFQVQEKRVILTTDTTLNIEVEKKKTNCIIQFVVI